ncbi:MAG: hypothetical protein A4S09_14145 [Proteobacteria bacterium SG_bin7]|nr:MAG: hypothetical protein A4S09_14145 [Proteobacteria bacterium SG_bin7]
MKIKGVDELNAFTDESKWLVRDLLLRQGLSILAASPKSTKSFFCLELCVSIAANTDTLGHYKSSEACRVLYFGAEDTEGIIHERLTGLLKAKGHTGIDNLGILTSPEGLRLDTDEGYTSLGKQIELFRPKLVVLDCLYAISRASENDSGSILSVLEKLRLIRERYRTAVLLVHHTSKDSDSKRVGERLRGSSALYGFFETILGLRRDQAGTIFLDVEHRAAPSFQNVPIELKADASGISYKVVAVTVEKFQGHLTVEDKVIECVQYRIPMSLECLAQRTNIAPTELRKIIYGLLKIGKLTWTKQGYLRGGAQ